MKMIIDVPEEAYDFLSTNVDCIAQGTPLTVSDDVVSREVVTTGNEIEIIRKAKEDILSATNIETSKAEMEVLDDILFRCWQMGWLNKYEDEPMREKGEWIPIKTRLLTDEEKEYYSDLGYSSEEITFMYDCPLPDDGQSVLITNRYNSVDVDTFYCDDGCYFEDNCDEDDVLAWMPLPEPYKNAEWLP